MTDDEVKVIVDAEMPLLKTRLGLDDWRIVINYKDGDITPGYPTVQGRCSPEIKYDYAVITIHPNTIPDVDRLRFVLRHELLHIVTSPFFLYSSHAINAAKGSPIAWKLLEDLGSHVCERLVRNVERLMDRSKN